MSWRGIRNMRGRMLIPSFTKLLNSREETSSLSLLFRITVHPSGSHHAGFNSPLIRRMARCEEPEDSGKNSWNSLQLPNRQSSLSGPLQPVGQAEWQERHARPEIYCPELVWHSPGSMHSLLEKSLSWPAGQVFETALS